MTTRQPDGPDSPEPVPAAIVDALRAFTTAMDRDGVGDVTPSVVASRCAMYAEHGLHLLEAEWASDAIVAESRSAWAKRLAVGRERRAVVARYRRDAT